MLFNSLSFILLFLPLSLICYYLAAKLSVRAAVGVLVFFSLLFYSWWNPVFLWLLCFSIAWNYNFGWTILLTADKPRIQNAALITAIAGNLFLLFHYKYLYPLLGWFDAHGIHLPRDADSVILPLGISFFTFTQIGYLIDCRAGITKGSKLLDYLLFVTFFPHLIAGPILHHREMMPQFVNSETYRFKLENLCVGLVIFIVGLAKKDLVADHMSSFAKSVYDNPSGFGMVNAWVGALSYTVQLYFDFSGYSDMATGLALLFGFHFPANFNSPYKARSIVDFWQRWNMTLTRYLTLYLYNPIALGVTRRRIARGKLNVQKEIATPSGYLSMIAFPTFFTMIIAGVWHGAGLQFLIFGLLHGFYLSANHAWRIWGYHLPKDAPQITKAIDSVWKVGLTMLAVIIAQIFFRSTSTQNALELLKSMAGSHGIFGLPNNVVEQDFLARFMNIDGRELAPWTSQIQSYKILVLIPCFIWIYAFPNVLQVTGNYKPTLSKIATTTLLWMTWRPNIVWGGILGVVAAIAILSITGTSEFLYFQF